MTTATPDLVEPPQEPMHRERPSDSLGPAAVPVDTTSEPALDPHEAKLSPDDPRLRLRRPASRTLRSGPIVALVVALLGTVMLAVAFAFQPHSSASPNREDGAQAAGGTPSPAVPDSIRNAPASAPSATASRTEPRASSGNARAPSAATDPQRIEHEQELKAESSGILFTPQGGEGEPRASGSDAPRPSSAAFAPQAPETPGMGGGADDPNGQDRKNAFLDSRGSAKARETLTATVRHPRSPYEVLAGTIIPAVLITAINSDLPGPVIGQVRENVFDTASGNFLLIPQGARLLANYDSMVAWGQERVLLCWNRLVFPNGDSLSLECMPAADLQGAAGLTDSVDEHWFRIVKGAAVASLLAATTQAIAGNTTGFNPTVPQMWAAGAAGEINQAGQQITRRNLNIQPTITVRPGYSVNVIVTRDMIVAPYVESPNAPRVSP
jgi:type IV secretion system protein VirB10